MVDHTRRNGVYDKYDAILLSILDQETLIVQLLVCVIDLYKNIYIKNHTLYNYIFQEYIVHSLRKVEVENHFDS